MNREGAILPQAVGGPDDVGAPFGGVPTVYDTPEATFLSLWTVLGLSSNPEFDGDFAAVGLCGCGAVISYRVAR